jgi:hypothetical protein
MPLIPEYELLVVEIISASPRDRQLILERLAEHNAKPIVEPDR